MPSIEIVCVDQVSPTDCSHLDFAVESGTELISHRGASSLFVEEFASLKGCIYHLGNPDLKKQPDRIFFAYYLLCHSDPDSRPDVLQLRPQYILGFQSFLETLLAASPVRRLLFTSDWQFGPKPASRMPSTDLQEFLRRHKAGELRLNTAYPIHG